jgi:hypothetical protein
MTVVDNQGRIFGRVNLVDGAIALFVLLLIPLGYGTYLLFRPTAPRIESVSKAEISREEIRITDGSLLAAKLKVRGTGFTPLLRAEVGGHDALAFVYESPNSADVLIGLLPAGAHDLVLRDGVNEVARAANAVTIEPSAERASVLGVGWFTDLSQEQAQALRVGFKFPEAEPVFEVTALGAMQPARYPLFVAGQRVELARTGQFEREAVVRFRCDPGKDDNPCGMEDPPDRPKTRATLTLPGPSSFLRFALTGILPTERPRRARVQFRVPSAMANLIKVGDRDDLLDERAAVVVATSGDTVTLELGLDETRSGWTYRGQSARPGSALTIGNDRYSVTGAIISVTWLDTGDRKAP